LTDPLYKDKVKLCVDPDSPTPICAPIKVTGPVEMPIDHTIDFPERTFCRPDPLVEENK
jgi:hypothetical protein